MAGAQFQLQVLSISTSSSRRLHLPFPDSFTSPFFDIEPSQRLTYCTRHVPRLTSWAAIIALHVYPSPDSLGLHYTRAYATSEMFASRSCNQAGGSAAEQLQHAE
jgi:hypothetical protein